MPWGSAAGQVPDGPGSGRLGQHSRRAGLYHATEYSVVRYAPVSGECPVKEKHWIPGLLVGGVGAVLAFALENDDALVGIRERPLGVVLFVFGGLFLAWGFLQWLAGRQAGRATGTGPRSSAEAIKSIGGLVAVAMGVGAVAAVTIVVITTVTSLDSASTVAIATSAFGVVSTVVGAFMGIKIGTDQTGKAVDEVKASAAALGAAATRLSAAQVEKLKQDVATATEIAHAVSEAPTDGS